MQNLKEVQQRINKINEFKGKINIMEVCGTHTMAISRFGLRSILNENINLVSGPGCPVCVTPDIYLDYIYDLSQQSDIIIATYGDMIRVPGSRPDFSLEKAKARGAAVKMVYSSMEAVNLAECNPDKKIVFLGIGFETTMPATAVAVKEAYKKKLKNFFVLSMHKNVEPVMRLLLEDVELKIDGFLCPGHVAVIIGENGFNFLSEYNCPGVITGFDLEEVVGGIYQLVKKIESHEGGVYNAYESLVKKEGNLVALKLIDEVFEVKDSTWRGMGDIKNSGYKLASKYNMFDIENLFPMKEKVIKSNGCQCGEVLKGKIKPSGCRLFGTVCDPENPVGPCMVSSEGSCAAYYKYNYC